MHLLSLRPAGRQEEIFDVIDHCIDMPLWFQYIRLFNVRSERVNHSVSLSLERKEWIAAICKQSFIGIFFLLLRVGGMIDQSKKQIESILTKKQKNSNLLYFFVCRLLMRSRCRSVFFSLLFSSGFFFFSLSHNEKGLDAHIHMQSF